MRRRSKGWDVEGQNHTAVNNGVSSSDEGDLVGGVEKKKKKGKNRIKKCMCKVPMSLPI